MIELRIFWRHYFQPPIRQRVPPSDAATRLCYGARMNERHDYVVGVSAALVVALLLSAIAQDGLGIAREAIVVGCLAFAGILGLACVVGALVKTLVRAIK